jgi:hypothetical protein
VLPGVGRDADYIAKHIARAGKRRAIPAHAAMATG